jgi:hypothetical protein
MMRCSDTAAGTSALLSGKVAANSELECAAEPEPAIGSREVVEQANSALTGAADVCNRNVSRWRLMWRRIHRSKRR